MRQSYFPISPSPEYKLFALMVSHTLTVVYGLLGEEHSATLGVQHLLQKKVWMWSGLPQQILMAAAQALGVDKS